MLVTHKPKAMLDSNDKKSGTLPAFVNGHTLSTINQFPIVCLEYFVIIRKS